MSYLTLRCPECHREKEVSAFAGAKHFTCCHQYLVVIAGKENENFMLKDYTVTYRKLVTVHVHPPIPIRTHDWQAFAEGDEESGPHGWGETRKDAIVDLLCETEDRMVEVAA